MKKLIILTAILLGISTAAASAADTIRVYHGEDGSVVEEIEVDFPPPVPETGREHYVIYKEGYRGNRTELSVFDTEDEYLTWNGSVIDAKTYTNDIKYYRDGDEWVEFERGYERVSNNATEILESDLEIKNIVPPQTAVGDVIGHVYSTDIRAYINGIEVPSCNIGGRTAFIVEDVMKDFSYRDEFRTLIIADEVWGFQPKYIIGGASEAAAVSGNITGDIYATDIKTYFYDKELTAYNIGGRTAVAIEDLGGYKEWNDLGGRYFYDDETRTIKLEMLYNNGIETTYTLYDHQANIKFTLSDDKSQINAEFYGDAFSVGAMRDYSDELVSMDEEQKENLIPVMTNINGEKKQMGWYLCHKSKEFEKIGYLTPDGEFVTGYGYTFRGGEKEVYELQDSHVGFMQLDIDIVHEGGATVIIPELTKRQQTERDWRLHHWNTIVDRLDTDDYSFFYAGWFGGPHGGNYENLMKIDNDGNYVDYATEFKSVSLYGQKHFEDVTIDKENEKVYFHYDVDYVIDLKTGEMTEVN